MANVTQKHVQEVMAEQVARRAVAIIETRAATREAIARTGSPEPVSGNGYYDENGHWQSYLRCDVDRIDSGRGCAP